MVHVGHAGPVDGQDTVKALETRGICWAAAPYGGHESAPGGVGDAKGDTDKVRNEWML